VYTVVSALADFSLLTCKGLTHVLFGECCVMMLQVARLFGIIGFVYTALLATADGSGVRVASKTALCTLLRQHQLASVWLVWKVFVRFMHF
jgi:hypothetical protein